MAGQLKELDDAMVAVYGVEVTGLKRTKAELARLDDAITLLRKTPYSREYTAGEAAFKSRSRNVRADVFRFKAEALEGQIQGATQKMMATAMAYGRRIQSQALENAETAKGKSGRPKGRKSAGRNVTTHLINSVKTNVETQRQSDRVIIVGWHGWPKTNREPYFEYQELGTKGRESKEGKGKHAGATHATGDRSPYQRRVKERRDKAAAGLGVPPANSLGLTIPIVREELKKALRTLKK